MVGERPYLLKRSGTQRRVRAAVPDDTEGGGESTLAKERADVGYASYSTRTLRSSSLSPGDWGM